MEYDKKLIDKATNKICNICRQPITETEANNCEFNYTRTTSKHDIFVHIKCWLRAWRE